MTIYDIIDVSGWSVASEEPLGSKEKEWLREEGERGELWLWKAARAGTGDDWAEKLAERLAFTLDLPHARVELARHHGQRGVICLDLRAGFLTLVPGNEFLFSQDPSYPKTRRRKVAEHTVDRVLDQLENVRVLGPPGREFWEAAAWKAFVGYLLFDAWIGNQDRHHENWGVLITKLMDAQGSQLPVEQWTRPILLAPTFDHGSSLGQYENERLRALRLRTKDKGGAIEAWAVKAKTQLYRAATDSRPLTTFEAFDVARGRYPDAGSYWLERLKSVEWSVVIDFVQSIPEDVLSPLGKEFTLRLLEVNRTKLLSTRLP